MLGIGAEFVSFLVSKFWYIIHEKIPCIVLLAGIAILTHFQNHAPHFVNYIAAGLGATISVFCIAVSRRLFALE